MTVSVSASSRHGDLLEADMSDSEEGNCVEGVGPVGEEEKFYPNSSSQWEAEEEEVKEKEEATKPTQTAAITEKVTRFFSFFYPRSGC